MTAFGEYLSRIKLTEIKLGPFKWNIEQTPSSEVATAQERSVERSFEVLVDEGITELDNLIRNIEHFDAEAGGVYYIGATLIRCDSFLEDNGIVGEPKELTLKLMAAIDNEMSNFVGGVAPYVPLTPLNTLKKALKQMRAELERYRSSYASESKSNEIIAEVSHLTKQS